MFYVQKLKRRGIFIEIHANFTEVHILIKTKIMIFTNRVAVSSKHYTKNLITNKVLFTFPKLKYYDKKVKYLGILKFECLYLKIKKIKKQEKNES